MIKPANTRVETKILVLHFLHSGSGGSTNLILHGNNTTLIFDFNFPERENSHAVHRFHFLFLLLPKNKNL